VILYGFAVLYVVFQGDGMFVQFGINASCNEIGGADDRDAITAAAINSQQAYAYG